MATLTAKPWEEYGEQFGIGGDHFRAWVGPPDEYDLIGALQFRMLTTLGMREFHTLLDVGCGSLRGGRLSILYLRPGNYFGIEPTKWAVEQGTRANLGDEMLSRKRPLFSADGDFTLTEFGRKFDFINCHSVFSHAARRQILRCMQQAREVMKKDGVFVGTFVPSDRTYEGDEWCYPQVSYYKPEAVVDTVTEAGLKCTLLDEPHPYEQKWFVATHPENKTDWKKITSGYLWSAEASVERWGGTNLWRERKNK